MNDIHLYSGFVRTIPDMPFKFEVDELEIEKIYPDGTIETKYPYFISSIDSTYYFGGNWSKLDKIYNINDNMQIIYSTDKQKCMDFVTGKRKELIEFADNFLKKLNQSKVEDLTNKEGNI